jgi:hypothetical protein
MLIAFDLDGMNLNHIMEIREFVMACNSSGYSFAIITSSLPEKADAFKTEHQLDADFYFADDISLKTMIRSNPGLILLNKGVVAAKWHYNDFPEFQEVVTTYSN